MGQRYNVANEPPAPAPDPHLTALIKQYAGDAEVSPAELTEAVRQYRAVETRYRGTSGWLKAPNGQPSNLNERQWVLTRTPNFKRWFGGDWETLAKQARVTTLRLPSWDGDVKSLTTMAREIYAHRLQGREFDNLDTRQAVRFTAEGRNEAFVGVKQPVDAQVVEALIRLVRRAVQVDSETPNAKRQKDTKAFHTLVAPLQVGQNVLAVKLTIRESLAGPADVARWKFYDVAILKTPVQEKARLGHGLDTSAETASVGHPSHPGLSFSVGALLDVFKGDNLRHVPHASKVVDANGEPLLVYHGTTSDFPAFRNGPTYLTASPVYAERGDADEHIMPLFASIHRPATGQQWQEATADAPGASVAERRNQAAERLQASGFDGVDLGGRRNVWVAFRPTQVKSAIGNAGTFRPDLGHLNKAMPPPKPAKTTDPHPAYREAIRKKLADLAVMQRQIAATDRKINEAARDRLEVVQHEIDEVSQKAYGDDNAGA